MGKALVIAFLGIAAALALGSGVVSAAEMGVPRGAELLGTYCSGCHRSHDGVFDRISSIRKTPEGWTMTLFRMRQVHAVVLDDGVRDEIVRYLSDTQGLAPSEAAAGRFALERRPNAKDLDAGEEINGMCGRCHSLARSALQRRDEVEWRKLAHTHAGQWPSVEYSASGRDRPWWKIASGPLPAVLAARYPFDTQAWSAWRSRSPADLSGNWIVVGHVPGGRDFYGRALLEAEAAGEYQGHYDLTEVGGRAIAGVTKALVYTGYEWRGSAEIGGRNVREVYAVSEDGNRITGRWFDPEHSEDGGEWTAVRDTGVSTVLAILPQAIRAGETAALTVVGTGLDKVTAALSIGGGVKVSDIHRTPVALTASVSVPKEAPTQRVRVAVGAAEHSLVLYTAVDAVSVLPSYGIARVGGGRVAPVTAQFEAIGTARLPDGEEVSLGPVRAEWASAPFDTEAARTEDEKFAGHFDQRGRFYPSGAGPNPLREFSGNNVGNLKVIARIRDGARDLEGAGHLIVTVQRWNTPPIY